MKRVRLWLVLVCAAILCSSCIKPRSYPLDTDIDAIFMSHIDQYTAAAEILWEYGAPLVSDEDWDMEWGIHPDHPEEAIDSPLFLNYFTQEQWQVVSDAYHLTKSSIITYRQSYWAKEHPDSCVARGIEFSFITQDSNGKKAGLWYVYVKHTPGTKAQQIFAVNEMVKTYSVFADEWEKLDGAYWYKGRHWLPEGAVQ